MTGGILAVDPITAADLLVVVVYHGDPVSAPRPRVGKHGNVYVPPRYQSWRDGLSWAMTSARPRDRQFPVAHAVGVQIRFDRKTRRRADLDNLLKGVLDAGNGILWIDDVQVIDAVVRVRYDPRDPKVTVAAYEVEVGA